MEHTLPYDIPTRVLGKGRAILQSAGVWTTIIRLESLEPGRAPLPHRPGNGEPQK